MLNDEISLRILKLIVDHKIKPSDFINVYKTKKDISQTIKYILTEEKKCLRLFTENESKSRISDKIYSLMKCLDKNNSFILDISHEHYPELLKEIYFPPPLLFCKGGEIIKEKRLKIAVVGTRNCSDYGREAAAYISRELSKIGFTIASGMALGIDKIAHLEALKEKGGSIGVLGTGIDITYPYENKKLYNEILENGGLITEFLPGTPPLKCNFPARNRIISGISIGVIVIEANERSGAVVTAKSAIRENREVFAVPGSIFSEKSKGCHMLIKSGAKLAEGIDDILEELSNYINDPSYKNSISISTAGNYKNFILKNSSASALGKDQKNKHHRLTQIKPENFPDKDYLRVYECFGYREKSLEEINRETSLNINKILQIVSYLEINNIIKENSFNNFVKVFY